MTEENAKQLTLFESPQLAEWRPVRDDFNFCRLALFVSSDKKRDRFRNIRQVFHFERDGKQFDVIWEVRHDAELGLPSTFDRDVWLGLMDIVQEVTDGGRKPIPDVIEISSLTDFLKRIGKKSDGGSHTKRVKESIKRLTLTTCVTEKAFNCPSGGGYLSLSSFKPLHLIEECAFRGDTDQNGRLQEKTWIRLGEYVRKNLDSGYIALLDVRYVQALRNELAKHLYSFLSYRFWLATQRGRDYTTENWRDLAEYLAVSGWDSLSRAKQRLSDAINELKRNGYIDESSSWNGDSYVFTIGEKFIDELRNRLRAREHYQAWAARKSQTKQLTVIRRPTPTSTEITPDEQRETLLIRQAIRIAVLRQEPDPVLLAKHGWTIEDARGLAQQLKAGNQTALVHRQ